MNWFKSIWFKIRKTNGLPGNETLIPMQENKIVEEKPKKPRKPRIKKEIKDVTP